LLFYTNRSDAEIERLTTIPNDKVLRIPVILVSSNFRKGLIARVHDIITMCCAIIAAGLDLIQLSGQRGEMRSPVQDLNETNSFSLLSNYIAFYLICRLLYRLTVKWGYKMPAKREQNRHTRFLGSTRTMTSTRIGMPALIFLLSIGCSVSAQETEDDGLKLPEDIAARESTEDTDAKFQIEESRVGTRLDRVTVRRKNGPDGVYINSELDSMWVTEETELGEVPNVRRWTIGSW
jgi:hypothetical protein